VIHFARENDITWLPHFEEEWIPNHVYGDVRFLRSSTKVGVEIGGVVGAVPLRNGDTLQVTPKVGNINFVKMLAVCEGLYDELKQEFDDLVFYEDTNDLSISWFVARSLAKTLLEINTKSLRFDHKLRVRNGDYASGKILPVETQCNLIRRTEKPIVFAGHERIYNNIENRVLGKAAQIAARFLSGSSDSHLLRAAESWVKRFATEFNSNDLVEIDRLLLSRKLGGSRGYYVKALGLAKIILGQAGITSAELHQREGEGILIRTSTLFERYIRKILVDSLTGNGVLVTKGSGLSNQFLYTDGYFELEPDFVFHDKSGFRLIADAKYKVPDSKDHYQMVCYLSRYKVKTGILIKPSYSKHAPDPICHTTPDGYAVWEVALPLEDLSITESILVGVLAKFAQD